MRTLSSLSLVLLLAITVTTCRKSTSESTSPNSETSSTPRADASPQSDFEKTLQFVRNGRFTYVYVFSRKDGKPLDPQDSQFLHKNAPQVVDWVATEDKKKVIAGTNFNLEEGNLNVIKKRLVVEDYTGR